MLEIFTVIGACNDKMQAILESKCRQLHSKMMNMYLVRLPMFYKHFKIWCRWYCTIQLVMIQPLYFFAVTIHLIIMFIYVLWCWHVASAIEDYFTNVRLSTKIFCITVILEQVLSWFLQFLTIFFLDSAFIKFSLSQISRFQFLWSILFFQHSEALVSTPACTSLTSLKSVCSHIAVDDYRNNC